MGIFFDTEEKIDTREEHSLWCEKYRPYNLSEYVGSEDLKNNLSKYISSGDIPHMLLHSSSPGTGKTTAAKMIARSVECDCLYINASEENKIDTVRDKIKSFASSMGFKNLKIIILDEGDYLTVPGQAALRNMMETYAKSTRFILTCNYVDRMIPAIISRCQTFEVIPPSKKDIAIHLINILNKENIKYEKESVAFLINSFYPDIRRIINTAQQSSIIDGDLKIDKKSVIENDAKLKLIEILKVPKNKIEMFTSVRKLLADNKTSDYTEWFTALYRHIDEYGGENVANVIVTIASHQYQSSLVPDKEINFVACVVEILDLIHKK